MERKRAHGMARGTGGFTLIEVLLVVAILGILAAVAVVNVGGRREEAMIGAARTSIKSISAAADLYEVDTGKYPSSLSSLVQNDAPNWNGPYIKGGKVPVDPWGSTYSYRLQGRDFTISSAGPDLSSGTGDDITN